VAHYHGLLTADPVTGYSSHFITEDDHFRVIGRQDVAPALDRAHALASAYRPGPSANTQDHFRHVGEVPVVIWALWENMGITEDPRELKKALERNPKFRTTTGHLL
jgi:hypothetical protein